MNIIAVDDEYPALCILEEAIIEAAPDSTTVCFLTAGEALEHAREATVDVAFLDIGMAGMSGLELAKALKNINKDMNILFVTGSAEYAVDAFSIAASGYIMKPADAATIAVELGRLRNPVEPRPAQRVRIQCFGNFGVFVNEKPLLISWAKPKELLAYLVHKQGAGISAAEIAALLWEDKPYTHSVRTQTQRVITQLMKLLDEAGAGDIVQRSRNSMAVDVRRITCDYYDFLRQGGGVFTGEYMSEYSWGEHVAAYLNSHR